MYVMYVRYDVCRSFVVCAHSFHSRTKREKVEHIGVWVSIVADVRHMHRKYEYCGTPIWLHNRFRRCTTCTYCIHIDYTTSSNVLVSFLVDINIKIEQKMKNQFSCLTTSLSSASTSGQKYGGTSTQRCKQLPQHPQRIHILHTYWLHHGQQCFGSFFGWYYHQKQTKDVKHTSVQPKAPSFVTMHTLVKW